MTAEAFKEYLDFIVKEAFVKGVLWAIPGSKGSIDDAIKKAQEEILERKV